MEITLLNTQFSYYFSSQAVYLTGEVLDHTTPELSCHHPYKNAFDSIKNGLKINLKYTGDDTRQVLDILTHRIVKVQVVSLEVPQDTRFKEKFIFTEAALCAFSGGT